MKIKNDLLVLGCFLLVFQSPAQTINVLHSFTGVSDGAYPYSGLVLNSNTLYGTTFTGGGGTIFKVDTDGTQYSMFHSFAGKDGTGPTAGLLLNSNILYGTTSTGGTNGNGTIYKINICGSSFEVLHSFSNSPDGATSLAGLVINSNTLYGTTFYGGSNSVYSYGLGTVFKINADGTDYAILYSFTNISEGAFPRAGLLVISNTLYGVTEGSNLAGSRGTIFKINTDGSNYAVLYHFTNSPDGVNPGSALLLISNTLYGTTEHGGSSGNGTVFKINTDGTGYAVLHDFTGSDGSWPWTSRLLFYHNTMFGTTSDVGPNGNGTIYKINADGTGFSVVSGFESVSEGSGPQCGLILNGDTLFGTTTYGGPNLHGVVFSLNLAPIIQSIVSTNNTINIGWTAVPNFIYQPQYSVNLSSTNWFNLGGSTIATNNSLSALDASGLDSRRFYRVQLLP